MTQPIRLKITAKSAHAEKPPSIEMKLLIKRIVLRCLPCLRFRSKDEKLPLTPRDLT
ncbi:hypothetical protein BpHYR1_003035, partial [Brachionus plicatilis]